MGSLQMRDEIHAEANKRGLLAVDVLLCAALMDMYAKCKARGKAHKLFEKMPNTKLGMHL